MIEALVNANVVLALVFLLTQFCMVWVRERVLHAQMTPRAFWIDTTVAFVIFIVLFDLFIVLGGIR